MNSDFPEAETIDKEAISDLHFPHDDIFTEVEDQQRRHHHAERAATLGNAHQGKVTIYFQTADGATKRVNTTVWATHQEYITLKAGITLPLRAIQHFDFQ